MKIIVGSNAGFCFGVKKAVDGSLNEVAKTNKKIYCLGELVHNNEVINEIKEDNVKLIIRAHGIDKKLYNEINKRNIEIIDFTCPFVKKIHDIAEKYQELGYYIFLIGNKNHPEIIGTSSHCGNNYSIIEKEEDLLKEINKFRETNNNLLVIVQTTFSKEKFKIMENILKEKLDTSINIVIKNTICNATDERQHETKKLAKQVDFMIIIGGKNSSNTRKLYDIASESVPTILIETPEELDLMKFKEYDTVGIMAGTSTPLDSINNVVSKLKSIF